MAIDWVNDFGNQTEGVCIEKYRPARGVEDSRQRFALVMKTQHIGIFVRNGQQLSGDVETTNSLCLVNHRPRTVWIANQGIEESIFTDIPTVGGEKRPGAPIAFRNEDICSGVPNQLVVTVRPSEPKGVAGLIGEFAVVKSLELKRESFPGKPEINVLGNVIAA